MKVLPTSKALPAQEVSEEAAADCHSHHSHEKDHWSGGEFFAPNNFLMCLMQTQQQSTPGRLVPVGQQQPESTMQEIN